ncbi:ESX secretion-associated protein EspG [Gordonia sp. DT30]|uniref:ESX secretion-associated protein EspG n=1 Tax=unclassified Gordonia (in: high G+C Gram-positive bacteria) TaxID=2657482 RepID=UPI003CF0D496
MSMATLDVDFALSVDEILTLADRLGVDTLPDTLALWPTQPTVEELERVRDRCARQLSERDLIVDGEVDPDLAHVVVAMRRPERELSIRIVTADGLLRASLLRVKRSHVVATRRGDTVRLRAFEAEGAERVIAEAARLLPTALELECGSVSAPALDVAEHLAGLRSATPIADELHAFGADSRSALVLGAVLADYRAAVEMRVSALDQHADRSVVAEGAVAVFYSARGCVLSAPSTSPDGRLWCSIKGGSDHRIAQAIAQLMSLLPEGW